MTYPTYKYHYRHTHTVRTVVLGPLFTRLERSNHSTIISSARGPSLTTSELFLAHSTPPRPSPEDGAPHPPLDRPPYFRNYVSYTFARWPNARVPYTIDEAFDKEDRLTIAQVREECFGDRDFGTALLCMKILVVMFNS